MLDPVARDPTETWASQSTWPLAARAQQTDRMRRLGMLMVGDENDALRGAKGWFARFTQGLAELGWTDGRNLRMDVRWVGDSVDRARIYAKELVDQLFGLQPQTSSETRVDPHPDISFAHFLLRREPAACSINYLPTRKTFSSKRISRLRSTPPLVATHAAVACDDAMTWDGWVVIGSHDSADGAGCLRIAALAATSLYVIVFPFGIFLTMSRTLSEKLFMYRV